MEKIRVGVVGLGHRGRHMARLVQDAFDHCATVVAACDSDPVLWHETQWLQQKPMKEILPNAVFYENYIEMLDHCKIDIVMVETGADVHASFCIEALNRNMDVFSDIPSVANLKEADALWKAEQASKGKLMTGANPNEWGFINALVDLYQKGLLGKPYYMEAEYIHSSLNTVESKELTVHSPWRKLLCPIRYCTHSLGPLLRIMEEDLRYVVCMGTGNHFDDDSQKDNMSAALFQTESGVTIRLLRNGKCRAGIGSHSYRVFGTKGYYERLDSRGAQYPAVTRFRSDDLYGAHDFTILPSGMMANEYIYNPKASGHGGADYALMDHMFTAYLNGDAEYPISLREGLRMTLPGIFAEESSKRKGERLRMTYPWDSDWSTEF
ncbi:MAG: Gfo/Idh/MocA family oxidoreductase [Lentisphaeria bacterium]|nr:Gfo/Idh/MocA family oxidoreductase [Lentisphaeria bacterium]